MSAPALTAMGLLAAAGGAALYLSGREKPTASAPQFNKAIDQLNDLTKPRGIRNNNPLNIRWNGVTQWRGMAGIDEDGFVIFDTSENGIRAAARILGTYRARGEDTVTEIIASWAPDHENPTEDYAEYVAGVLGIGSEQTVQRARWPELLAAMIYFENGAQPYSMATIERGVAAA